MSDITISNADVDDIETSVEAGDGDDIVCMGIGDVSIGYVALAVELTRPDGTQVPGSNIAPEVVMRLRSATLASPKEGSDAIRVVRASWKAGQRPVRLLPVPEDDPEVEATVRALREYAACMEAGKSGRHSATTLH